MGQSVPKILVIDDDEECLDLICRMLRQGGYKTVALTSGNRVLQAVEQHDPALVLTDILMPGVTGGMVYDMIRAKVGPYLPVVVCSGTRLRFKERDPLRAFLLKPVGCETLLKMVGDLMGLAARLREEEEAAAAAAVARNGRSAQPARHGRRGPGLTRPTSGGGERVRTVAVSAVASRRRRGCFPGAMKTSRSTHRGSAACMDRTVTPGASRRGFHSQTQAYPRRSHRVCQWRGVSSPRPRVAQGLRPMLCQQPVRSP